MASCSIRGSIFWCFRTPLLPFFRVQSQLVITRPFLLKGRSDSYSISLPIWYKNSFRYYLFSVKWRKPTSSSVLATCSFVRIFFLLPLLENQFLSMVTKLWNIWDSSSFWMPSKSALAGARDEFPCCFVQRTRCSIAADAPSLSSAAAFWARELREAELFLLVCGFFVGWILTFSVRLSFFFFIYEFKHVIHPPWWGLWGYS